MSNLSTRATLGREESVAVVGRRRPLWEGRVGYDNFFSEQNMFTVLSSCLLYLVMITQDQKKCSLWRGCHKYRLDCSGLNEDCSCALESYCLVIS